MRDLVDYGYQRARSPRPFVCNGVEYDRLVHLHNRTWTNERAVEVPLARSFLAANPGPILEVGNVMAHYGEIRATVVDKYEQSPDVLNVDVVDYAPIESYGAILCISTLEHIGWDEEPRDPLKISRAVLHLRRLLAPTGRMLITCPLSYNPHLDRLVADQRFEPVQESFLVRRRQGWHQTDRARALSGARMNGRGANAIWVAEFSAVGDPPSITPAPE